MLIDGALQSCDQLLTWYRSSLGEFVIALADISGATQTGNHPLPDITAEVQHDVIAAFDAAFGRTRFRLHSVVRGS
jgi:hypothetical protein